METPRRSRRLAGLEPCAPEEKQVAFLVSSGEEGLSHAQIACALFSLLVIVPLLFLGAK